MKDVVVPSFDVNSDRCTIVRWLFEDGAEVRRGEIVVEVETSKALLEVEAPSDGFLLHERTVGQSSLMTDPVARLFESREELARYSAAREERRRKEDADATPPGVRATKKAMELAAAHGIDLAPLAAAGRLIQQKDVEAVLAAGRSVAPAQPVVPLRVEEGVRRLLLVGAGYGATQVLEILKSDGRSRAVAAVDDKAELWGTEVNGVPIVGGTSYAETLFRDNAIDAAVISISTSVRARHQLRQLLEKAGIPLANAIDPSCRIASDARIGSGNVLCAFCHVGNGAVIGDNNFLSAYNSVDHHCTVGSDCSTGPGCMVSGLVRMGDRLRLGTGVFVEPYLEIGDDVAIASGSIILRSIPPRHTVKAKAGQSIVVPQTR